jgi:magnesium chelatase family protein
MAKAAMEKVNRSVRGFHRTQRIARTIADLTDAEEVGVAHLVKAVQQRQRPED